jgi:hypothetical protein
VRNAGRRLSDLERRHASRFLLCTQARNTPPLSAKLLERWTRVEQRKQFTTAQGNSQPISREPGDSSLKNFSRFVAVTLAMGVGIIQPMEIVERGLALHTSDQLDGDNAFVGTSFCKYCKTSERRRLWQGDQPSSTLWIGLGTSAIKTLSGKPIYCTEVRRRSFAACMPWQRLGASCTHVVRHCRGIKRDSGAFHRCSALLAENCRTASSAHRKYWTG